METIRMIGENIKFISLITKVINWLSNEYWMYKVSKPVHESESSRVTCTGNPWERLVVALLTDLSLRIFGHCPFIPIHSYSGRCRSLMDPGHCPPLPATGTDDGQPPINPPCSLRTGACIPFIVPQRLFSKIRVPSFLHFLLLIPHDAHIYFKEWYIMYIMYLQYILYNSWRLRMQKMRSISVSQWR
jgi:hypothetical protein